MLRLPVASLLGPTTMMLAAATTAVIRLVAAPILSLLLLPHGGLPRVKPFAVLHSFLRVVPPLLLTPIVSVGPMMSFAIPLVLLLLVCRRTPVAFILLGFPLHFLFVTCNTSSAPPLRWGLLLLEGGAPTTAAATALPPPLLHNSLWTAKNIIRIQ